jgi:hypothetical protein
MPTGRPPPAAALTPEFLSRADGASRAEHRTINFPILFKLNNLTSSCGDGAAVVLYVGRRGGTGRCAGETLFSGLFPDQNSFNLLFIVHTVRICI